MIIEKRLQRQALSISAHCGPRRHCHQDGRNSVISSNVGLEQGESTINAWARIVGNGQRILSNIPNKLHRHHRGR